MSETTVSLPSPVTGAQLLDRVLSFYPRLLVHALILIDTDVYKHCDTHASHGMCIQPLFNIHVHVSIEKSRWVYTFYCLVNSITPSNEYVLALPSKHLYIHVDVPD